MSNVDRSVALYRDPVGFGLDHDTQNEHMHVVQLTPRGSEITVSDESDGDTFFGFADPDGDTWAVQEIGARAERPLIPPEARQPRFGADG